MIKGYGDEHEIIMELDTTFDLGKREHYVGTEAGLTKTYGKGYFYIIYNQSTQDANFRLNEGESMCMRGSYIFKSK